MSWLFYKGNHLKNKGKGYHWATKQIRAFLLTFVKGVITYSNTYNPIWALSTLFIPRGALHVEPVLGPLVAGICLADGFAKYGQQALQGLLGWEACVEP